MGGMAEIYREIHKDNVEKMKVIAHHLREKCVEADLPVTGLNECLLYQMSELIYRYLLIPHHHDEFTPIEQIMATVKSHINVVDCYIFIKLQEIHYNIHLAGVWHNDGLANTNDLKIEFRQKLLAFLENRTELHLHNDRLPSRQSMLCRLEESYDFFNEPATQQILKDNIRIDLFTAIKQGFELLCSAVLPIWSKARLKGFYHLFNTTNDARVNIVQESYEDVSYQKVMRHKAR